MSTWRVEVAGADGHCTPITIEAEPESSVTTLLAELEQLGHSTELATVDGRFLDPTATFADLPLVHGSVVDCSGTGALPRPVARAGTYLCAISGPDAGSWWPLTIDRPTTIGRAGIADIGVNDSLMSSEHCTITLLANGTAAIADHQSRNGTSVEGIAVTTGSLVEPGSYIHAGSSVLTTIRVDETERAVLGHNDGPSIPFQRRFREALEGLEIEMRAPREPSKRRPQAGMILRSLTPLFTGLMFAFITGRWYFLVISVMSPIMFGLQHRKRQQQQSEEEEENGEKYAEDKAVYDAQLEHNLREKRLRDRSASLPGGYSTLFSFVRHRRVWERLPSDQDFLALSVGLARLQVEVGEEKSLQWGKPLQVEMGRIGSLAIVGQLDRARAIARGLVMNLAASHSPSEVKLWIVSDSSRANDWEFTRWLPHTFIDETRSRIAMSEQRRNDLIANLRQEVEARRAAADDSKKGELTLPIHIVIFDGPEALESSEITRLLVDGRRVGLHGITIDEALTPEGAGGTLTIGAQADEASFESVAQPFVENVLTAEMRAEPAMLAARSLAGLRPSGNEDVGSIASSVRLIDMLGIDDVAPESIAADWLSSEPSTSIAVGMAADTPFVVDVVSHGPHGLVGGTTRSGKSEFLKTLITGLCLRNHPDDLSLVVVDFKGGIDYELAANLPHLVDVTGNMDIAGFTRTIELIDAEQRRRQVLFKDAQASNLNGYRKARSENPDLIPIPRLIVVVDEFSELLENPEGKDRLKRLESVTRIGAGLGVHLLLVTQNFENQLPAQIAANAGMRICFRVQAASHSKAVLDVGTAAEIPAGRPGRAMARLQGRDLQEFQSARVAGRRKALSAGPPKVNIELSPIGSLLDSQAEATSEEVPSHETDMHELVYSMIEAAKHAGWTKTALPWTGELSRDVALGEAFDLDATGADFPIGVIDLPHEQRVSALTVNDRTPHLALIGDAGAGVVDALISIGTSAALRRSPDDLHIYGIDLAGEGLDCLEALPHCGTVIVKNEQLTSRLVRFLADEAALRRARMKGSGKLDAPHLLVLINGADRMLSQGDGQVSQNLIPLIGLMKDAPGTGVQLVLSGSPQFIRHRLGQAIDTRLICEIADDANLAGLVPREHRGPLNGRLRTYVASEGVFAQIATVGGLDVSRHEVLDEIGKHLKATVPQQRKPRQFEEVVWPLEWDSIADRPLTPPADFAQPLPMGLEVETGEMVWLDNAEDGPVVAVIGPRKSGKTTALHALARWASELGWFVVAVPMSRRSTIAGAPEVDMTIEASQLEEVMEKRDQSRPVLVLLDDIHRYRGTDTDFACLTEPQADVMVAMTGPPDFFSVRTGVLRQLPDVRSGMLLSPAGSLDGQALGLRRLAPDTMAGMRPGKGIFSIAGEPALFQVPNATVGELAGAGVKS